MIQVGYQKPAGADNRVNYLRSTASGPSINRGRGTRFEQSGGMLSLEAYSSVHGQAYSIHQVGLVQGSFIG